MNSLRIIFPGAVALLVLTLLAIGEYVYDYPIGVMAFPLGLGSFVLAMAILALATERRAMAAPASADLAPAPVMPVTPAPPLPPHEEGLLLNPTTWVQFAAIAGLLVLCWSAGFIPGIVIFVSCYLWRAGWRLVSAAVYGLAAGLVIWLLFDLLFTTPLPFWPIFMR